ncbi:MAG: aminodeoxychorismate/anthranilate synthase component II [Flavobacteriia bacterium]|nr:aminodeoxychorismate/anthranilate synthase component II [Flavobacteriia bacterium]
MKILIIDNYDSFTYNLVHDLERNQGVQVDVVRNDEINFESLRNYDRFVISPGPGLPHESGELLRFLEEVQFSNQPVLGVCLGLQAMVKIEGGELYNLGNVRHGTSMRMKVIHDSIEYTGLPREQGVGLYHSWAALRSTLPSKFTITAESEDGVIMSLSHQTKPWIAWQYHPESVLSECGREILRNWVERL